MWMQKHGQLYKKPEKEQHQNVSRVFLSKNSDHGYGCMLVLLVKLDFGKTHSISIEARDNHLVSTYLFPVLGHEFKAFIKIL